MNSDEKKKGGAVRDQGQGRERWRRRAAIVSCPRTNPWVRKVIRADRKDQKDDRKRGAG